MAVQPAAQPVPVRLPVFSKFILPKVAFGFITLASLAGASLTGLRHGVFNWPYLALRWGAEWTAAVLLGALIWQAFYLAPSVRLRPRPAALEYAAAMRDLFRRWEYGLVPAAAALLGANLWFYAPRAGAAGGWWGVALGLLVLAVVLSVAGWRLPPAGERSGLPAVAGWAAAMVSMAALHVALQAGPGAWALMLNRGVHLLAFAAWLGGAFWNILIAVPVGLPRQCLDTAILAHLQLDRFRSVVQFLFPTLFLTGLVQVWGMFGWGWRGLYTTTWGYFVLFKLALIACLVGIFILCPMWRACSPMRGACNLADLED